MNGEHTYVGYSTKYEINPACTSVVRPLWVYCRTEEESDVGRSKNQ